MIKLKWFTRNKCESCGGIENAELVIHLDCIFKIGISSVRIWHGCEKCHRTTNEDYFRFIGLRKPMIPKDAGGIE